MRKKWGVGGELLNLKLYSHSLSLHSKANTTQGFPSPPQIQPCSPEPACPLRQTHRNQEEGEEGDPSPGAFAELRGGARSRGVSQVGKETPAGLPTPGPPPASPRDPHQSTQFQLTSSPRSLRKHSREASPPPPLGGAGDATPCPRAWPREDTNKEEVRARLPGTGPRQARGPGGGWEAELAGRFASIQRDWDVERKTTRRRWKVRKANENTLREPEGSPQNAAGSRGFALFLSRPRHFRLPN